MKTIISQLLYTQYFGNLISIQKLAVNILLSINGFEHWSGTQIRNFDPVIRDSGPLIWDSNPAIRDSNPLIRSSYPSIRDSDTAIRDSGSVIRFSIHLSKSLSHWDGTHIKWAKKPKVWASEPLVWASRPGLLSWIPNFWIAECESRLMSISLTLKSQTYFYGWPLLEIFSHFRVHFRISESISAFPCKSIDEILR